MGREDGVRAGEFNAVLFRDGTFDLLDSGTFWLSEEPGRAGSKGWDGACERLATWVVLRRGSDGREFLFINTHLDHEGETARREGVALLRQRIDSLRGDRPVILTGDFNAEPDSPVIAHVGEDGFLRDARLTAAERSGPAWSFSDFGRIPEAERPLLDYIFIGGGIRAVRCEVLPDTLGGGYLLRPRARRRDTRIQPLKTTCNETESPPCSAARRAAVLHGRRRAASRADPFAQRLRPPRTVLSGLCPTGFVDRSRRLPARRAGSSWVTTPKSRIRR